MERHLPEAQGFADDHQVCLSFRSIPPTNQTDSVIAIENCVAKLRSWMISNMLMVNDIKTEFLILGSKQQLKRVNITFIHVGEDQMTPVMSMRNLGVISSATWKWICKSQRPAKALTIISTTTGQSNTTEPGSHVHEYACICNKPDWLLQKFDGWTIRQSHQETPACAKHSCQTSFKSEEIWSHNSRTCYVSLASSQVPDWIQNTVVHLQWVSWKGT